MELLTAITIEVSNREIDISGSHWITTFDLGRPILPINRSMTLHFLTDGSGIHPFRPDEIRRRVSVLGPVIRDFVLNFSSRFRRILFLRQRRTIQRCLRFSCRLWMSNWLLRINHTTVFRYNKYQKIMPAIYSDLMAVSGSVSKPYTNRTQTNVFVLFPRT